MTDFRALCAELVAIEDALSGGSVQFSNQGQALDGYSALATFRDVADRARTLLAEADGPAVSDDREPASVTKQPSDAELLELMPETMRDEFSYAANVCSDATGGKVRSGIFRVCLNTAALEYARAVLASWGGAR